jgi:hypothetical protein
MEVANVDALLDRRHEMTAAETPISPEPVEAWFGVEYEEPRRIRKITAYPARWTTYSNRAMPTMEFLARSLRFQYFDDEAGQWKDIPECVWSHNTEYPVQKQFNPIVTSKVRVLIERSEPMRNRTRDREDPLFGKMIYRAAVHEIIVE